MAARFRDRIRWWDYLLAAAGAGTMLYVLSQGAYFGDRATMPTTTDWLVGVVFVVLLLEGTRRATGFIMPGVAIAFAALCPVRQSPAAALDASRLSRSRTSSRTST